MLQQQQTSPVNEYQQEYECLSNNEADIPPNFLKNFTSECKMFFMNLYEEEACHDRRILMEADATRMQHLLQFLVKNWCVIRWRADQYLNSLKELSEQDSLDIGKTVDKIMEVSHSEIVIVGVTYLVGYQYGNKHCYVVPVFRVYRSECDEEPIFVDTNAKDYKNLADCLTLISLPESLVCLPQDGTLRFNHNLNILPLEFYIKQSNSIFLPLPFFLSCNSIGINLLKLMRRLYVYNQFGNGTDLHSGVSKLNSCAQITSKHIKHAAIGFSNFVNRNFTYENLKIIIDIAFSVYFEYYASFTMKFVISSVSYFVETLSTKGNIKTSSSNMDLILNIVSIIIDGVFKFKNDSKSSDFDFDDSKKVLLSQTGVKILSSIVQTFLEDVNEIVSLMTHYEIDTEKLKNLSRKIFKALDICCVCLNIYGVTDFSSLFRSLNTMYKNYVNSKIRKEYPSKEMKDVIDLTGEDYSLANFLRVTVSSNGKLNEEGKMWLKDVERPENMEELVPLKSDDDRKNLFVVNVPLKKAANIVKNFFEIESSFEQQSDDSGKFYDEKPGQTFILYNYREDKFDSTFICQSFRN